MAQSCKYLCPICYRYASLSFKVVLRHLAIHSSDPAFHVTCGILECPRTFSTYSAYKKHVYRHHRLECGLSCPEEETELELHSAALDAHTEDMEECDHEEHHNSTSTLLPPQLPQALMLLKLKQKYKLSQMALNAVTDEFTDLLQSKISQIKDELHHILTSLPVPKEQLKNLTSVFQQPDIANPFSGLHNRHQQEYYFTNYLGYQVRLYSNYYCQLSCMYYY